MKCHATYFWYREEGKERTWGQVKRQSKIEKEGESERELRGRPPKEGLLWQLWRMPGTFRNQWNIRTTALDKNVQRCDHVTDVVGIIVAGDHRRRLWLINRCSGAPLSPHIKHCVCMCVCVFVMDCYVHHKCWPYESVIGRRQWHRKQETTPQTVNVLVVRWVGVPINSIPPTTADKLIRFSIGKYTFGGG